MSDFGHYGGSDEENANLRKLNAEVDVDPDNFENWEALITACEGLEGGLNRNSSPQALATFRDTFDRFLLKFPLFFAYWGKYANLEFNIAGPESAEMVYERGIASVTNSVDLWKDYCSFKMETTHDPQLVRELFERGASHVGLDFFSHPFWDKYIEYEERQEAQDRIFAIHARIITIPLHQFARYYERFRNLSYNLPTNQLVTEEVHVRFKAEVDAESAALGGPPKPHLELDRDIRTKIDAMFYDVHTTTQSEVTKRWTYESEIKRPYFHVTELEHGQLSNWRKYLDFEEQEGDYKRIVCLYERCLTTAALYDEFWFRYARWMHSQSNKDEEARNIYIRAATMFVPISRPGLRLQWAYFEESAGRIDVALAIHEAILLKLPDCIEVIDSWANLNRRQYGVDAAIQVYKDHIDAPTVDLYTKAALVAESARMIWQVKGSAEEARAIFNKNVQWYADSRKFWEIWFQLEVEQVLSAEQGELVKHVFHELRSKSRLSAPTKRELTQVYLDFLVRRGGKDGMKTFLAVDREMFGPPSVSVTSKVVLSQGELDEASKKKAEAKLLSFYELHGEPSPDIPATTSASFH